MSEHNNDEMQAENPLELELIFADGVFISPLDAEVYDVKSEVSAGTGETAAENGSISGIGYEVSKRDKPQLQANEKSSVEVSPTLSNKESLDEEMQQVQQNDSKKINDEKPEWNKPVRVLIRYRDGLFEGEEQTRDLIRKFFSIITKNGRVLDESFYELIDIGEHTDFSKEQLLNKALRIIVFGTVDLSFCNGLKHFEVRTIDAVSVVQFPSLEQIMKSGENKQQFALALKKYFGQ